MHQELAIRTRANKPAVGQSAVPPLIKFVRSTATAAGAEIRAKPLNA
jgi:hypothetical protein